MDHQNLHGAGFAVYHSLPLFYFLLSETYEKGQPLAGADRKLVVFLLVEVALQQAFESLAVAGFIAGHFMHGVVDGVEVQLLGELGQLGLACGCAVFGFDAHFEVLLGGVGHDFAQQLSELARHENRLFAALRAAKRLIFFASLGNDLFLPDSTLWNPQNMETD